MALLELDDLSVSYRTNEGDVRAAEDVSLTIEPHETLGLVGESGCGKSTIGRAIIRILAKNATIVGGSVRYRGRDLTSLSFEAMRPMRWKEIAFIPQSAMNAFNPVYRIGRQIDEIFVEHQRLSAKEARKRTEELFEKVHIPVARLDGFPHQFSGGMRQRALIAMALALQPPLIIADEPTTALDVAMQDRIFSTLRRLRQETGSSLLLITHDMGLVAENCDTVAVMYAGRIVERGPTRQVLSAPSHPYTMGLKNAFPSMTRARDETLISIPGSPPANPADAVGCRFAPRCPFAQSRCSIQTPALQAISPDHIVACHYADQAVTMRRRAIERGTWSRDADVTSAAQ
jgi:oligopeptide/dipeptide ABC transporter ATP-binding protein